MQFATSSILFDSYSDGYCPLCYLCTSTLKSVIGIPPSSMITVSHLALNAVGKTLLQFEFSKNNIYFNKHIDL